MFAAATCDAACLAELLDAGADPNQMDRQGRTPLHYAVIGNDVECVYLLVATGADPLVEDDYGYTTIDMAASTYLHDYLSSLPPLPPVSCPGHESLGPRSTATI
ncbi:hypothetical protein R5R35_010858 [Gryllus longicercus]|uniref:Uncharacterized protein n=1 Tax=Gryllus longicercus TaxID=2509291 RepID=A0AAN9YVY2_9ORTH